MKVFNKLTITLSFSILILILLVSGVFIGLFKQGITNLPLWTVLAALIFIILVLFFIYIIFIGLPLEKISDAVSSLVKGNEYIEIKVTREDEIGSISHFINQVVEKVKNLSGELLQGRRVLGEVNMASTIQKNILPKTTPDGIIGLDIVARSKASSEIGGDNFDIIQSGQNTIFYIGDVTGHGVPAALIMTMANTAIRAFTGNAFSPKEIIIKTNELLFQKITTSHFMSAVMLRWDNEKQKMFFTGAGHETIILYSKETGKVNNVKSGGIALKMIQEIEPFIEEKELPFFMGDSLILYSDGVTEAKNQFGKRYGIDKLIKIIENNGSAKVENIFKAFTEDYSDFVGSHPQEDDVSIIIINNVGHHWKEPTIDIGSRQSNVNGISGVRWSWE